MLWRRVLLALCMRARKRPRVLAAPKPHTTFGAKLYVVSIRSALLIFVEVHDETKGTHAANLFPQLITTLGARSPHSVLR